MDTDMGAHPCNTTWTETFDDVNAQDGLEDGQPVHIAVYTCDGCGTKFAFKRQGVKPA